MKNKNLLRILVFAVLLVMIAMNVGCTKSEVAGLLSRFEKACNESDADAVLECIIPSVAKPIQAITGILGDNDALQAIADWISSIGGIGEMASDWLASIRIKPESFVFNDAKTNCTVTATVTYQTSNGEDSRIVVIDCTLSDDVWYISGFSL